MGRFGFGPPAGDSFDVIGADGVTILGAQQVFEQNLDRERQAHGIGMLCIHGIEPVNVESLAGHAEMGLTAEGIKTHDKILAVSVGSRRSGFNAVGCVASDLRRHHPFGADVAVEILSAHKAKLHGCLFQR